MTEIKIFVDGACSLKNNRGGIGIYCDELDLYISLCIDDKFEKKTNSITELYAIKHVLETLNNIDDDIKKKENKYIIFSDSRYAVNSLTVWIYKWMSNNWLCQNKKPVMHKELICESFSILCELQNVSIVWISRDDNKMADKLAKNSILI